MRSSTRLQLRFVFCCWCLGAVTATGLLPAQDESPVAAPYRNPLRSRASSWSLPAEDSVQQILSAEFDARCQELRGENAGLAIVAMHRLRDFGPAGANAVAACIVDPQLPLEVRNAAARSMAKFGSAAAPALLGAIRSAPPDETHFAWWVLGQLGSDARPATSYLTDLLARTDSSDERLAAIRVLDAIGSPAREAIPTLLTYLRQDDDELQLAAAEAIRSIGISSEQAAPLIELLLAEDEEPELQIVIAESLVNQPTPSPVVLPVVIGLLQETNDWSVCEAAARLLQKLGDDASDAAPALMKLLDHDSPDVAIAAAQSLGSLESAADVVIAALIQKLHTSEEETIVEACALALARCSPEGVKALREGLTGESTARTNTLHALRVIGKPAGDTVPELLEMLADPDCGDAHIAIVQVLQAIGAEAESAVPALTAILASDLQPEGLRAAAAHALAAISDATAPALFAVLQSDVSSVRIAAAAAILQNKLGHQRAVAALIGELADEGHTQAAADALQAVGVPAFAALSDLAFDSESDLEQRRRACSLLSLHGTTGAEVLVQLLSDPEEEIVRAAHAAILDMGQDEAFPALLQALTKIESAAGTESEMGVEAHRARLLRLVVGLFEGRGGPAGGSSVAAMAAPPPGAPAESAPDGIGEWAPDLGTGSGGGGYGSGVGMSVGNGRAGVAPKTVEMTIRAPAGAADSAAAESVDNSAAAAMKTLDQRLVTVFYGTNRIPVGIGGTPLSSRWWSVIPAALVGLITLAAAAWAYTRSSSRTAAAIAGVGVLAMFGLAALAPDADATAEGIKTVRPGPIFGGDSQDELELGFCEVSIPKDHRPGELESPSILRLEFEEDPRKHIVLREVTACDESDFHARLDEQLNTHDKSMLVFVHGYNVDFDDAARRTAQLAVDLKFAGVPLFFSWPSQGNWYEYRRDEKQVDLAVPALKRFLLDVVGTTQAKSIHLIAHSMGSRALTTALKEIQAETQQQSRRFQQVILAAPDIDADIFRTRIAPAIVSQAERVTLYASSNDLALLASRTFNSGDLRAGDTSRGMLLTPGVETIDCSAVDTSLLGHSYYGDSPTVLTDLQELLTSSHPADARPYLQPVALERFRYWVFQHPALAGRPGTVR